LTQQGKGTGEKKSAPHADHPKNTLAAIVGVLLLKATGKL
jgi:hypothetical protein